LATDKQIVESLSVREMTAIGKTDLPDQISDQYDPLPVPWRVNLNVPLPMRPRVVRYPLPVQQWMFVEIVVESFDAGIGSWGHMSVHVFTGYTSIW